MTSTLTRHSTGAPSAQTVLGALTAILSHATEHNLPAPFAIYLNDLAATSEEALTVALHGRHSTAWAQTLTVHEITTRSGGGDWLTHEAVVSLPVGVRFLLLTQEKISTSGAQLPVLTSLSGGAA